jgi:ABC-type transporter Mla subunit MlaD
MKTDRSYVRLGLFILLAVGALIALVVVLGTGSLFRKDIVAETYFNESVQGLDVGSKVLFRGVLVGSLTRLSFTYVKYERDKQPNQRKPYVLVEFVVRPQLLGAADVSRAEIERIIAGEVERGLRVREVPQGVTGLSFLELDYTDPKRNPPLPIDWQPQNLYVPSTPSTVGRIVSATEELVRRLGSVDVEGFVTNVNKLAATLTQKVDELDLEGISTGTSDLIADLRKTNQRLQKILAASAWDEAPRDIASASRDVQTAARDAAVAAARVRRIAESDQFSKTIDQLQRTMSRLDKLFAGRENDIAVTLNNLRQTSENLRELSENAKRYPSGVIFGEPPRQELKGR